MPSWLLATSPSHSRSKRRSLCSAVSWNWTVPEEATVSGEPLRATEAARRLGITTKELVRLVHQRRIRFVMRKGIAHIPVDAIDEFRNRAS